MIKSIIFKEIDNISEFKRKISLEEAKKIERVIHKSVKDAQTKEPSYSEKQIEKIYEINSSQNIVHNSKDRYSIIVQQKDETIGIGMLKYHNNEQKYELVTLYIDPESKGQGVGSKIISKIEKKVKSLGGLELFVCSSPFPSSNRFYQKKGFKIYNSRNKQFEDERVKVNNYLKELV